MRVFLEVRNFRNKNTKIYEKIFYFRRPHQLFELCPKIGVGQPARTLNSTRQHPAISILPFESSMSKRNGTTTSDDGEGDASVADIEREIWESMTPMAWHKTVVDQDSIFRSTYRAIIDTVRTTAEEGGYDVILEVGCGTGDIIGELAAGTEEEGSSAPTVPCIGVDVDEETIGFCRRRYPSCEFHVAGILTFREWWETRSGHAGRYEKPLVVCANNTLNVVPHELRGGVVDAMIAVAGPSGLCLVSYWHGHIFAHAVLNHYKKHPELCGDFDIHRDVDWDRRILLTPTQRYRTHWLTPLEAQALLRSYDVDVSTVAETGDSSRYIGTPHIRSEELAIFVWFDRSTTSSAKGYYDSEDAQKFYTNIWGQDELHVGRYDLITEDDLASLSTTQERIRKAEEYHELCLLDHIKARCGGKNHIVDMGCGYGGLIRRLYREGLAWKAVGCDISHGMCERARQLNADFLAQQSTQNNGGGGDDDGDDDDDGCLEVLCESYLQIYSVADETVDLVVSMDALLHVGPERQRRAVAEAARILRPGGWMIFSDIMQEDVLRSPADMQPIYDRINLTRMGTVSNYTSALEDHGFSGIATDLHSENIPIHYGHVLEATLEKGASIGLSEEYLAKAIAGLEMWKEKSPGNIAWGIIAAQKTPTV